MVTTLVVPSGKSSLMHEMAKPRATTGGSPGGGRDLPLPLLPHASWPQLLEGTFTSRQREDPHTREGAVRLSAVELPLRRKGSCQPHQAHPRTHSLPPSGPRCTRMRQMAQVSADGHTRHMECSRGPHHSPPPTGQAAQLCPARSTELSARLRSAPPPPGPPPGRRRCGPRKGADGVLACLVFLLY